MKFIKQVSLLLLGGLLATTVSADTRTRTLTVPHAGLSAAWQLLDCGERYKSVWYGGEEVRGVGKTYRELIASYDQVPAGSGCTENDGSLTHDGYLVKAVGAFRTLLDATNPALSGEHLESAKWGYQESFNYLVEGRLLKGNDLMINGLRSRFKADNSETRTQIELLNAAVLEMKSGLELATPEIIGRGTVLRTDGDANPTFPFLVNNTKGPTTPNDYQRYAELLNRYGMAAASEAKYLFYRDNVKDVDNPPYKNFPGPEDLDINNNRIQDEAGRIESAQRAKEAGSHLYLQSLVLASKQSEDDFQSNNGYQIKRQVNDIDRLYQDIQSGFNPLLLAGDFVPYQKVENFLQLARARVDDAISAESLAKNDQRTFEVDQTTLASELRNQTNQYVDQLIELTGVSLDDYVIFDSSNKRIDRDEIDRYKQEVLRSTLLDKTGLIGTEVITLEQAELQTKQVRTQITNASKKLVIEQERSGEVGNLIFANGEKMSLLQYANTMASCCNVSKGTSTGTSKGTSNGWSLGSSAGTSMSISIGNLGAEPTASVSQGFSFGSSQGVSGGTSEGKSWGASEGTSRNPNIETLAEGQSKMAMLQAIQQADLDAINSKALLKNMALELATLDVSLEEADKAEERQKSVIEKMFARADRLIANYAVAQEDFSQAYYSNPAYRVEASRSEQRAEDTFETAIELSYYAAKALEYQWSEKYNNPVLRLDGAMPEPLAVSFDPFVRSESVFTVGVASELDDYMDALAAWDVKMRQLRYPNRQTSKVRFSLRDDLLGFGEYSPEIAEAKFRSFIEDSRYIGANTENRDLQFEFTLDIADERLFPAHPNIKIENLSLNLVSTASRSLRGGSNMSPALVDLVLLDRAFVRTFFAEYPERDDLLSYTLQQGRTIEQSPFLATVEASVDGYASPEAAKNSQLENHSPAVSTWVLRMKNNRYNNRNLQLQYLSDIELEIEYSFGKPRDFQFPL